MKTAWKYLNACNNTEKENRLYRINNYQKAYKENCHKYVFFDMCSVKTCSVKNTTNFLFAPLAN